MNNFLNRVRINLLREKAKLYNRREKKMTILIMIKKKTLQMNMTTSTACYLISIRSTIEPLLGSRSKRMTRQLFRIPNAVMILVGLVDWT